MNAASMGNALLFQLCWFACVLGGARGTSAWGLLALTVLAVVCLQRPHVRADLLLVAVAAPLGFALDSVWIRLGVLDYGTAMAPAWIVLLWAAVALTVNHSLAFLKPRPLVGGLLAGLCAPLSYLMGERLGAVTVPDPWLLTAVAMTWFGLFSALFAGARSLEDHSRFPVGRRTGRNEAHTHSGRSS